MGTKCGLLALVTGNGGLWSCRLIESSGQVTKRQGGCGFQYLFNSSSEKVVAGSVGRPSSSLLLDKLYIEHGPGS